MPLALIFMLWEFDWLSLPPPLRIESITTSHANETRSYAEPRQDKGERDRHGDDDEGP